MSKSLFIVAVGPAGSGKGYILEKALVDIKKNIVYNEKKNFNYGLVDNYVEIDLEFIKKGFAIIDNDESVDKKYLKSLVNMQECNEEINKFTTNTQDSQLLTLENLGKQYSNLYFDHRSNGNDVLNFNIKMWLQNRENIVLETTGQNNFEWIFKYSFLSDPLVRNDYIIVVVYPYVNENIILARALNRFAIRTTDYLEYSALNMDHYITAVQHRNLVDGKICNAIRFPVLINGDNSLKNTIPQIHNTLAYYINKCSSTDNNVESVDYVLIYDNNSKPDLIINMRCTNENIALSASVQSRIQIFSDNYKNYLNQTLKDAISNLQKSDEIIQGGSYKKKYTLKTLPTGNY
jgi:hypothetical protein